MPKNVMKLLKPSNNQGKNDFDLSHRHLLTLNLGELVPATFIETVPGDYIKIKVADLLRAIPMVTSPFLRVKQHIDVWFTEYDDLWHNFSSFMVQKEQPVSSALGGFSYCPRVDLKLLHDQLTSSTQGVYDVVGRNYVTGAKKLFNLLGYGRTNYVPSSSDSHPSVNLWRLAQYNKVWYEEYRNQYYDNGKRLLTGNNASNAACLFNFDDLPCNSVANADITASLSYPDANNRVRAMLQMRYRQWKKDLFNGLLPSTQFGGVSVLLRPDNAVQLYNNNPSGNVSNAAIGGQSGVLYNPDGSDQNSRLYWRLQNTSSLGDILSLRRNEALQIWRENALRAGNRISDNLRAHYGDDAEYNDHRSRLLGSFDAPLNIGDVNSTAQVGTGANQGLADVAGKGLSSLDSYEIKFNSKKFGSIMVLISLLPEAEYLADGIDRSNQLLESEDYFVKEYQNIGLEAVSSQTFYSSDSSLATIPGYAPRYWGYKQKLDKVFEDFYSYFAPWSAPKLDVRTVLSGNMSSLPLSLLYVNPTLFDNNFAASVANSPEFLADIFFDVEAHREMSVIGLPQN